MDKPERRRADIHAKYIGFTIPDAFVVGYGPVSYTHLPVFGSGHAGSAVQLVYGPALRLPVLGPVSYTHLDVYKRQMWDRFFPALRS